PPTEGSSPASHQDFPAHFPESISFLQSSIPLHSQEVVPVSYSVHFHSWEPPSGVANIFCLGLERSARITCRAGLAVFVAASAEARVSMVASARVVSAWAVVGVLPRIKRESVKMARALAARGLFM